MLVYLLVLTTSSIVFAQTYPLPKGFQVYTYQGKEFRLVADFDKDGKQDLIVLVLKENNNQAEKGVLLLFLSANYRKNKTFSSFYIDNSFKYFYDGTEFSFEEGVLRINCAGGGGKYTQTYHFKYMPKLKNMQLIGFDERSVGAMDETGALDKKVDLLAQTFEIKGMKKTNKDQEFPSPYEAKGNISIPSLTFKDFDESGKNIKLLVDIDENTKK